MIYTAKAARLHGQFESMLGGRPSCCLHLRRAIISDTAVPSEFFPADYDENEGDKNICCHWLGSRTQTCC